MDNILASKLLAHPGLAEQTKSILKKGEFIFIVEGGPERTKTEGIITILIGLVLTYFFIPVLLSIFSISLKVNFDEVQTMFLQNFLNKDGIVKIYVPFFTILFVFWLGIRIIWYGFKCLIDKKQYFIGTKRELIILGNKTQKHRYWTEFTGKYRLLKNNTTLELELIELKDLEEAIVNEVIKIRNISSAQELASICRQRIESAPYEIEDIDDE